MTTLSISITNTGWLSPPTSRIRYAHEQPIILCPCHKSTVHLHRMAKPICMDAWIHQVMPALRQHDGEFLLKELLKRWQNHKIMVRWLSRFFNYLDR